MEGGSKGEHPKPKKIIKKRSKNKVKEIQQEDQDYESPPPMPKKNLQIEVIEHPEANSKAEDIAVGEKIDFYGHDSNRLSTQNEPDHRHGTLGAQNIEEAEGEEYYEEEYEEEEDEAENKEYTDSMDDNAHKEHLQSFGQDEPQNDRKARQEDSKIKQNANNGGIQSYHLNEFMDRKSKEKDIMNKTTKIHEEKRRRNDSDEPDENSQENNSEVIDDALQDDELILKQQQEAEALLEETKKTMQEEDNYASPEEEEEEADEDQKIAKENKYEEELDNEEDENDGDSDNVNINTKDNKFSLNYTVGRIEDGAAILISKDHNLIEIPL